MKIDHSKIRAVTIRQPRAWAIATGATVLCRGLATSHNYRGPLFIHSSGLDPSWDDDRDPRIIKAMVELGWPEKEKQHRSDVVTVERVKSGAVMHPLRRYFDTGVLLGWAEVTDIHVPRRDGRQQHCPCRTWEDRTGWYQVDTAHLVLRNHHLLPDPVPCNGKSGFWKPEPPLLIDSLMAAALPVEQVAGTSEARQEQGIESDTASR